MITSHATSTPGDTTRTRNALRVVVVLLIAALSNLLLYLFLLAQSSNWQVFVVGGSTALLIVALLFSAASIRRGRVMLGAWLSLGAMLVAAQAPAALIANLGLPLAVALVLATVAIATQTLPHSHVIWSLAAGIAAGALSGTLDLFGPFEKLQLPLINVVAPLIIISTLVLYGVFVARQFRSYSLRNKLIIGFLIVALIPLGTLAILNSNSTQAALTRAAGQSLESAARQTAAGLDAFFATTLDGLEAESRIPGFAEYVELPPAQRAGSDAELDSLRILRALARKGQVKSYGLLDLRGQVLLDTEPAHIGHSELDRDYFQEAVRTRFHYVSPVETFPGEDPQIYFSAPIRNIASDVVGVLRVSYGYEVLQNLVRNQNDLGGNQSFGALLDGSIYLAHGKAPEARLKTIVALDDAQIASLQASHRLPDRPASDLAYNLPDLAQGLLTARSEPFFTAMDVSTGNAVNQIAVASLTKQPRWQVVFLQPREEFLKLVGEQNRLTVLLGLGVAGVVVSAALFVSGVIARPIRLLTTIAEKVQAGDLHAEAAVTTDDEIGRLAGTFNSMTTQIRALVGSLEQQVESRMAQIHAGTDVGRAVTSILDPNLLMNEVVSLITDRFDYYYAAIFTLDETGRYAVLRAATGEAGEELLERKHRLEVGGRSMVGYATGQRKARIALDIGDEPVRFANPLLPYTRSEIALPLVVGNRVLGALDVQSTQESAFDESSTAVLQGMADQIAVALNNARLYTEAQVNIAALNGLLEMSRDIAGSRSLDDLYARVPRHFRNILDADNYYFAIVDEGQTEIRFVVQKRPDMAVNEVVVRAFGSGRTEYVIRTRQVLRLAQAEAASRLAQLGVKTWDEKPAAFLGVPIVAGDRVLGMIGLQDFEENALFTDFQERLTIAIANQIGVTLDNLRLVDEAQRAFTELDAANRRLTSEGWTRYTSMAGAVEGEWHAGHWTRVALPNAGGRSDDGGSRRGVTIPIRVRGESIGEFELASTTEDRELTADDIDFARALIDQVGQAIETARLLAETERLAARDRLINSINSRVRQTVNMDSILKTAVNELGQSLGAVRVIARIGESHLPPVDTTHTGNGEDGNYA